jgi:hypothetical protein
MQVGQEEMLPCIHQKSSRAWWTPLPFIKCKTSFSGRQERILHDAEDVASLGAKFSQDFVPFLDTDLAL